MALDRTITVLAQHPVFAALEPEALRILAFSSDRIEVGPGTRLFTQGAPADSGYVLLSGDLELEVASGGRVKRLGRVPPGALLGEMALLCEIDRPATAIARSAIEAIRIPRTVFRRLLEEYPAGAEMLRQRLSDRLLTLTGALDDVRTRLERGLPASE